MSVKKAYDEDEMEKIILRPYHYILQTKVYDLLKTKVIPSLDYWLKIPKSKVDIVKEVIVMFSHAAVMLDDVEDDATFRRALPAAHAIFGKALTINCSLHAHMLTLQKVLELGHPQGAEIYCRAMLGWIRGTSTDLYWRDNQTDITDAHYKQMAVRKTGDITLMLLELMQYFSDNKTDYTHFLTLFGIYYQIRDDYCNLKKVEALEAPERVAELQILNNIDFCEDLSDGKISFPVIHSIKSPSRDVILGLLKMRTRDMRVKKYLLSLLEQTGGLESARRALRDLELEMDAEISRLGGNPLMEDFLRDWKNWDENS